MTVRFSLCAFVFILGSCATTTPAPVIQGPTASSAPIVQDTSLGLKRKVAVLRFSNETKYGRGVFSGKDSAIEKQAEDILKSRLVDSGAVLLIESDIASQESSVGLSSIGADFVILGSVSEFGRQVTSETGVFSRTKKQVAYAAVNLRLVDARTGQVIYSEEGRGEADIETGRVLGVGTNSGYDSSINDKAISAAIGKLVGNVLQNLDNVPWRTSILDVQGDQILLAGGPLQGLEIGDLLSVMKRGKVVDNRQFGGQIELPATKLGVIKILSFFGNGVLGEGSVCTLTEGKIDFSDLEGLVIEELDS